MIQEQIYWLGDKMAIMLKTTASFLLLGFISFGSTLGNTVSVSQSSQTGNVGEPSELTCQLNPTSGAIINSVKWFLGSDMTGIQRSEATCSLVGSAPSSYDLNRYSFTCSSSSNTFKLKILALKSSDDGQCWSCSVTFSNFIETDKASACIKVNDYTLLLLLLLLLILAIFIILICCGCLDCCKCCRIFDHYDEKECCYVTWYCLKRGCCSFFCCRAESKRGTFSCCCKSEKECCGGCHVCQKKCGCGWPDCCKSKKMRSCGGCYCICCVEGLKDESVDENRSAINWPPAIHIGTQNKVQAEPTNKQPTSNLHRPQPPTPGNSDARDQNIHGQSAKYDNTTGLATDATRPIKLPPLLATK